MNNIRNRNTLLLFLIALILQVSFILCIKHYKDHEIKTGRKIIVQTVPVDPRSLFRGDFIILSYDFSRISLKDIKKDDSYFYRGQTIYTKLTEADSNWKATQISNNYIQTNEQNEIIIKGTVQSTSYNKTLNISYGIESYFVPEGKGKYIESQIAKKRVKVQLSIGKSGRASVCKILIDGKEIDFR